MSGRAKETENSSFVRVVFRIESGVEVIAADIRLSITHRLAVHDEVFEPSRNQHLQDEAQRIARHGYSARQAFSVNMQIADANGMRPTSLQVRRAIEHGAASL